MSKQADAGVTRRGSRPRGYRELGMTVIEVVVAVAVLSLVSLSLFSMLTHSITGWSSGTSGDTATGRATFALQRLAKEIRDAKSAQLASGQLAVTFPRTLTDTGTGETIYDLSGSDPTTRYYYVSNGDLVRSAGASVSTLAKGIISATFSVSGGTVTVSVTGRDQVGKHTATRQITGRIALRNYRS